MKTVCEILIKGVILEKWCHNFFVKVRNVSYPVVKVSDICVDPVNTSTVTTRSPGYYASLYPVRYAAS